MTRNYDDLSDDDVIDLLLGKAARVGPAEYNWKGAKRIGTTRGLRGGKAQGGPQDIELLRGPLTNGSTLPLPFGDAIRALTAKSNQARRGDNRRPHAGDHYLRDQGGSTPQKNLRRGALAGAMGRLFEDQEEDRALGSINHLLAVATALLGDRDDSSAIRTIRSEILAGRDPLGEAYSHLRPANVRRLTGVTLTPIRIVKSMIEWAVKRAVGSSIARIVDPGAGTGRFTIAAAEAFPTATVMAIENDPELAVILRANLHVHGLGSRAQVLVSDFRAVELPVVSGKTLFIGNPPYVRHHNIERSWKDWYSKFCAGRGVVASQLAGLHLHFFAKVLEIGMADDFGCLITAAEWLDVGYGSALRHLLADGLGGLELHVLEPAAEAFPGTMTTAAITTFAIGQRAEHLVVRRVAKPADLDRLEGGTAVPWAGAKAAPRWSILVRGEAAPEPGTIELGEFCRVHRGQVTGANKIWIAGAHARELPPSVLKPTITAAMELIRAEPVLDDDSHLSRVVDLPANLNSLPKPQRRSVERFISWARSAGAAEGYIARHRAPWWAIRLGPSAPIVCTYMARRSPAFVRNRVGACLLNIAHGIHPREQLTEEQLMALVAMLQSVVRRGDGRTYAGGLTKFEPGELERIRIPWPPING